MISRNTYNDYAEIYASLINEEKKKRPSLYHDFVVPAVLSRIGELKGLKVLDAGCGAGHVAVKLAERSAKVVAIDVSERLIHIAETQNAHPSVEYRVHDLSQRLPEYLETFDLVISNLVLNDIADYRGFICTLSEVTKKNGRVVLSINNPYSAVLRGKVKDYADSGTSIEYSGMAKSGLHVIYYHRTLGEYIAEFCTNGLLLHDFRQLIILDKKILVYYNLSLWEKNEYKKF